MPRSFSFRRALLALVAAMFSSGAVSAREPGGIRYDQMPETAYAVVAEVRAKAGKEAEVAAFLESGLPIVQEEPATIAWFGIQLGPSTFGIFDAFPDEAGRQAHLSGRVAAALMAKASELLSQPPSIEKVDVLAVKLP